MCASADASPTNAAAAAFTKFSLSPINTSDEGNEETDMHDLSSFHPLTKKQRLESPRSALVPADATAQNELDTTVPLDDDSTSESRIPLSGCMVTGETVKPKALFDMFRHQSTPMVSSRVVPVLCPAVASPLPCKQTAQQDYRPSLSRCASVPTEKLSDRVSIFDSFVFDGAYFSSSHLKSRWSIDHFHV